MNKFQTHYTSTWEQLHHRQQLEIFENVVFKYLCQHSFNIYLCGISNMIQRHYIIFSNLKILRRWLQFFWTCMFSMNVALLLKYSLEWKVQPCFFYLNFSFTVCRSRMKFKYKLHPNYFKLPPLQRRAYLNFHTETFAKSRLRHSHSVDSSLSSFSLPSLLPLIIYSFIYS